MERQPIEKMTASEVIKDSAIGFVIGALIALVAVMVSIPLNFLARLFGMKKKQQAARDGIYIAAESIRSSGSLTPSLGFDVAKNEVEELRRQVIDFLVSECDMSEPVAFVVAEPKSRLMMSRDQWVEYVQAWKQSLHAGYSEDILLIHSRLSNKIPTISRSQLVHDMVAMNVNKEAMASALEMDMSHQAFEQAIRMVSVYGATWDRAIMAAG